MLTSSFYNKSEKSYIINIIGLLISIYPLCFLLGSLLININTIVICILFLFSTIKNKNFDFIKNKFFILIFLLWISFIINLYFSSNFDNSLTRSIGFLRFLFLVLAIKFFFENSNKNIKNLVLYIWLISFFIISFDLIFEYIFGFNTLGFKSYMPGRLAGFLNEELKIGNIYCGFYLLCSVTIFYKSKNTTYTYFFIIFAIFISLIIGERSNFIKVILMSIFFIFFFGNKNLIKKFLVFFLISTITFSFIMFNEEYKKRFYGQFIKPIIKYKNPITFVNNTVYGANFDRAIKIFQSNKLFGVGIKNFRIESNKAKYHNKDLRFNKQGAATHPHQIHLELLSETGIFGYFVFLVFLILSIIFALKKFLESNNYFILSSTTYFIFALIPLIPSGSFFTTYVATMLWINYGFMSSELKID